MLKKIIKNSLYSIISYLIIIFLGFLLRKIFIEKLGMFFLGYEGLFSNIFYILSISELGITSVITYNLYNELAKRNIKQINILMAVYKYIYIIIGVVIFILGMFIYFFLPLYLEKENINLLRTIFILQLFLTISTYCFSYRRILFICNQEEYICIKIETYIKIIFTILQIISIIYFKNYILYLILNILSNIISNFLISYKCIEHFKFFKDIRITKNDFKNINFFYDTKQFLFHKISYIIYSGTDNIVIASILGIKYVALYSNYYLIGNQINSVLTKIFQPIQASIGNVIYTKTVKENYMVFKIFNLICFLVASIVGNICFNFINIIISKWIGQEFLLDKVFLFYFSINILISWMFAATTYFRNSFGKYEYDKNYMILGAIINLIFSIIASYKLGLYGIILGTIIGNLFIIFGRIKFIFKIYFKQSIKKYLYNQLFFFILSILEIYFCYLIIDIFKLNNIYCIIFLSLFPIFLSSFYLILIKDKAFKILLDEIWKKIFFYIK